ncbi:MAG: DNA internalization-related competence protein ComEC/Rec2 [Calditrichaeota bacterium]|nr:MAG: DNA internalization-related competence protein ComEC/Rec2 [Calditrichota bacterium]
MPALNFFIPLILGIFTSTFFGTPLYFWLIFTSIFCVLSFIIKKYSNPLILISIFTLGISLGINTKPIVQQNHIKNFVDLNQKISLKGVVSNQPQNYSKGKKLEVETFELILKEKPIKVVGKILVYLKGFEQIPSYGDSIQIFSKIYAPKDARNPGEFDFQKFLVQKGIYGIAYLNNHKQLQILGSSEGSFLWAKIIFPLRKKINKVFHKLYTNESAGFLGGIILGDKSEISPEMKEDFANSGIIHLLAVSGLHVGFIALIILTLGSVFRFPLGGKILFLFGSLLFYSLLTDLRPSVIRASLMLFIFYLGTYLQRRSNGLNSVSAAGVLILIFAPSQAFDLGFQLSFSAVFGILIFEPIIWQRVRMKFPILQNEEKLNSKTLTFFVRLGLVSVTAQLGTLVPVLLYFGKIPVGGVLTNFFAIPLAGLIVGVGVFSLLISPFEFLAKIYANANEFFVSTLFKIAEFFGSFDFLVWQLKNPNKFELLLATLLVVLVFCLFKFGTKKRIFALLTYALFFSSYLVFKQFQEPKLKVTFIDVGQGDASLIQFPNGQNWLYDGGVAGFNFDSGEKIILPLLETYRIDTLDAVLVSHPDADHLGGIVKVLEKFPVKKVFDSGQRHTSKLFQSYETILKQKQIPRRRPNLGEQIEIGEVKGIFIHPNFEFVSENGESLSNKNNGSLSLQLIFNEAEVLFLGDCEHEAENSIVEKFGKRLESDLIKVGHHGSVTSSSLKLLKNVKPKFAVIQVGKFNRYNHPSDLILNRYKLFGAEISRNDFEGAVIFETDGKNFRKINWRE